ncbi:hypothetical protein RHMOL_Rhmol12G0071900 [Rhododendron molle]|uniref:Uncharacterized protein n=1 Tax=Rhododendron molle TaxID=49168 RepID=A0ACC0LGE7_RHOML|nr:hypothetical protein RHMOL_Rhmol12G0071900 [Rhododendron molle]
MTGFQEVEVQFVKRIGNRVAHCVAHQARKGEVLVVGVANSATMLGTGIWELAVVHGGRGIGDGVAGAGVENGVGAIITGKGVANMLLAT